MKNETDILKILDNLSLKYLSKFEVSENQFKTYINKKIDVLTPNLNLSKKKEIIDITANKMKNLNYINDLRFSALKSEKLFNAGSSKKLIFFKLKEKGICDETINKIISKVFKDEIDEIQSALIFTKRKKIGLFYNKIVNDENKSQLNKLWFNSLARRGFSYKITKNVFTITDLREAEMIINRIN